MGLLDRFSRNPPPTAAEPATAASDEEKGVSYHKDGDHHDGTPRRVTISPDVEKRVVRKLDLRLATLVSFLCMLLGFLWSLGNIC